MNEKSLWYFVGFISNNVAHVEHDFTDRNNARESGDNMFFQGRIIEGQLVKFNRVLVISDKHEIAFDIRITGGMLQ